MGKSKQPITKLKKKKTQYDSELQTSRISDLSSRIISKYEFLTK